MYNFVYTPCVSIQSLPHAVLKAQHTQFFIFFIFFTNQHTQLSKRLGRLLFESLNIILFHLSHNICVEFEFCLRNFSYFN
jgi:hypothetical protein